MAILIGIDTSGYLRRSAVVIGKVETIRMAHSKIQRVLQDVGHSGGLHWAYVPRAKRRRAWKQIATIIKESGLQMCVFEHLKPRLLSRNHLFLVLLPNAMSQHIVQALHGVCYGDIVVTIDADFETIRKGGSRAFAHRLVKSLAFYFGGVEVSPKVDTEITVKVVVPGIKDLTIRAPLAASDKTAIELADMVLGLTYEFGAIDRVLKTKIV